MRARPLLVTAALIAGVTAFAAPGAAPVTTRYKITETNHQVVDLKGQDKLEGAVVQSTLTGEQSNLDITGIFIAIGHVPSTGLFSGILDMELREVEIECLPTDIPDHIQVDVSGLRLGDHVTVADLIYDRTKVKVLVDEHQVVAGVLMSRLSEAIETPVEEEATGSQPEVIKKGKGEE